MGVAAADRLASLVVKLVDVVIGLNIPPLCRAAGPRSRSILLRPGLPAAPSLHETARGGCRARVTAALAGHALAGLCPTVAGRSAALQSAVTALQGGVLPGVGAGTRWIQSAEFSNVRTRPA